MPSLPIDLSRSLPASRWSVALPWQGHGSGAPPGSSGPRHETTARGPCRRTVVQAGSLDPRVASGLDPSSSVRALSDRPQDAVPPLCRYRRSAEGSENGGDEETRTPDPLLAKEMLCQLSYVPCAAALARGRRKMVGVSGLEPETSALSGQCSNQLS